MGRLQAAFRKRLAKAAKPGKYPSVTISPNPRKPKQTTFGGSVGDVERQHEHTYGRLPQKAADPSAAMRGRPRPKPARLGEPAGPRSLAGEKTRDFGREQFKPDFVRSGRKVDSHRDRFGSTAHHKRPYGGHAPPKREQELARRMARLSVPEKHALKIARDTLRMPDEMVGVMGGPDKKQAKEIIKRLLWRK